MYFIVYTSQYWDMWGYWEDGGIKEICIQKKILRDETTTTVVIFSHTHDHHAIKHLSRSVVWPKTRSDARVLTIFYVCKKFMYMN